MKPEDDVLTASGRDLDILAAPLERKPGETDADLRARALFFDDLCRKGIVSKEKGDYVWTKGAMRP